MNYVLTTLNWTITLFDAISKGLHVNILNWPGTLSKDLENISQRN